MTGVSFVVPVHNGGAHLAETLASIAAQADGRPMEVIVVEDGSQDGSAALLRSLAAVYSLIVIDGPRRGAAAAMNAGVRLRQASDHLPGRSGRRARTRLDVGARRRARRSLRGRGTGVLHHRRGGILLRSRHGDGSRAAVRASGRAPGSRLHRQHRVPRGGAARGRVVRRFAGLRLRQRSQLPPAGGRISADVLPRRPQPPSLA